MNRLYLHLIVLCLFSAFAYPLLAQDIGVSLPPSPEAASVAEHMEIPVGEFSGTANINIPIHTIDYRGVSLPISLSYHSNGIRVAEEASEVGLGWSLNAGGMITRVVRGMDDFGTYSTTQGCSNTTKNYSSWYELTTTTTVPKRPLNGDSYDMGYAWFLNCLDKELDLPCDFSNGTYPALYFCLPNGYAKDLESDLYSFNIMGYSGKFVIDSEGNPKLINVQDVDINLIKESSSAQPRWVIILPNGVRAYFGMREQSRQHTYSISVSLNNNDPNSGLIGQCTRGDKFISTWFLDFIDLPDRFTGDVSGGSADFSNLDLTNERGHRITFNYYYNSDENSLIYPVPGYSEKSVLPLIVSRRAGCPAENVYFQNFIYSYTKNVTSIKYDQIYLKDIVYEYGRVDFNMILNDRDDLRGGGRLSDIRVYKGNDVNIFKQFKFRYDYFDCNLTEFPNRYEVTGFFPVRGIANGIVNQKFADNTSHIYNYQPDYLTKRLKLSQFQVEGNGEYLPPYLFNYLGEESSEPNLPPKTAFSVDHWGLSNGRKDNSTLLPSVSIPAQLATNNQAYSSSGTWVPAQENTSFFTVITQEGAQRESDSQKSMAGLLKKISYPNSGFDEIEYEANEYLQDRYEYEAEFGPVLSWSTDIDCQAQISSQIFEQNSVFIDLEANNPYASLVTGEISIDWTINKPDICSNCAGIDGGALSVTSPNASQGFKVVLSNDIGTIIQDFPWSSIITTETLPNIVETPQSWKHQGKYQ